MSLLLRGGPLQTELPKVKEHLVAFKSSGEESESLTELCRQGKVEGWPYGYRSAVPAHYIAEVSYTGKEGARLANGTVEMLR